MIVKCPYNIVLHKEEIHLSESANAFRSKANSVSLHLTIITGQ